MGVGAKFWDLLTPYARPEVHDFLRNKRVSVDLSFWIVQHETAIKSYEPFECYLLADIEAGLGLKRERLIAISLLVGNDHDLNGVQGIGVDSALRFVQTFREDDVLNSLCEIGKGNAHISRGLSKVMGDFVPDPDENLPKLKSSHCSFCGHPGSKRAHFKSSCEYCGSSVGEGCTKKQEGFKCDCLCCNKEVDDFLSQSRKEKEQLKHENWQIKVCNKISMEPNFPNDEIIQMYLCNSHRKLTEDDVSCLSWGSPNTDMLVDFLVYHRLLEPSYIRRRMFPMLSTIYLREMAVKPEKSLLYGQYEFDSIQRVKRRYEHQCYVIKWKKTACTVGNVNYSRTVEEPDEQQEEVTEVDESIDQLEDCNGLQSYVDDGCWFLLTDENMDLVCGAFPDAASRFLQEKELNDWKRRKCSTSNGKSESLKSKGIQLNITEFYRSTKLQFQATEGEDLAKNIDHLDDLKSNKKRKVSSSNLPKSARCRLLFK